MRVIVVEDETAARRRLVRFLRDEPGVTIVGEYGDGPTALRGVPDVAPDVMFLDVQLPGGDGFETLGKLPAAKRPLIVFVTAHSKYAVRAYQVDAVDYLLKPFGRQRVQESLARVARRQESASRTAPDDHAAGETISARPVQRLLVRERGRTIVIPVEQVDWIEANNKHVRLHVGPDTYHLREPLRLLENRLDPRHFTRIHRSCVVNLDRIRELQPAFHGDLHVIMSDGTTLTMSRTFRKRVGEALGQRL